MIEELKEGKIKIKTTLNEIVCKGDWLKYCEISGLNEWVLNEGLANGNEEIILTIKEAKYCKLIEEEF